MRTVFLTLFLILMTEGYCQSSNFSFQLGAGTKPNFIHAKEPQGGIVDIEMMYHYKNLEIGPYLGYASAALTYIVERWQDADVWPGYYLRYDVHYRWNFILTGLKSCYRLRDATVNNRLGFYVGGLAARSFVKERCENHQPAGPPAKFSPLHFQNEFIFGVFAGGEYQVTDKGSLFAELGYGITYFNFGMKIGF